MQTCYFKLKEDGGKWSWMNREGTNEAETPGSRWSMWCYISTWPRLKGERTSRISTDEKLNFCARGLLLWLWPIKWTEDCNFGLVYHYSAPIRDYTDLVIICILLALTRTLGLIQQNLFLCLFRVYVRITFNHNNLHDVTNSITEIPQVGEQLPDWPVTSKPVWQYAQVWGNGCTRYPFTQHLGNLRVLAENRQQTSKQTS